METKTVKVRVPGTTANCGPGFDTLGIACTIYNDLELTLLEENKLEIEITGEGAENIPRDARNIVWKSIRRVLQRVGVQDQYKGARIKMHNGVPLSRGLGSSATAIVGGLKAANEALGNPLSNNALLRIATDIEGHPDNVAPAIFGGFTISTVRDGRPETFRFIPKLPIKMIVAVPDFYLSTKSSREVLPEKLTRQDAIVNIGSAATLIAALMKGSKRFAKRAFDDAIHQPYRASLIPGMYDVFSAAKAAGALGACLSGAGPCLIAFTTDNETAVGEAMVQEFAKHDVVAEYLVLSIDKTGATLI